ncbi:MAG TPA: type VI secretion system TssO [Flavipsychrobacter sp.]|nr:type VI secretion system TssO [Flavipsychrobacter sp.]
MKPQNTQERKKAFITFLGFYAITTIILLAAVFFGMRVPYAQNNRLQSQVDVYEKERDFAETFSLKSNDVKGMLDSINKAGVQAELLDGKISETLRSMNNMINDSTSTKKLYQDMVQGLADLQMAKKQLRDASGKDANLSEYMKQIETLKSDLNQARTDANNLRLQLMSAQR